MKIINSMIFMTLSFLVGASQAMNGKKKSSFRQQSAHNPMVLDFSDFLGKVNSILDDLINNNGEIVKSEGLLELEKDEINQESTFLTGIREILGKKGYTAQGNAGGRIDYTSLKKIVEGVEKFGVTLKGFNLCGKINKDRYEKYRLCCKQLTHVLESIEFIEQLQSVSQEEQIGSPRRKRLAKIFANKQL